MRLLCLLFRDLLRTQLVVDPHLHKNSCCRHKDRRLLWLGLNVLYHGRLVLPKRAIRIHFRHRQSPGNLSGMDYRTRSVLERHPSSATHRICSPQFEDSSLAFGNAESRFSKSLHHSRHYFLLMAPDARRVLHGYRLGRLPFRRRLSRESSLVVALNFHHRRRSWPTIVD